MIEEELNIKEVEMIYQNPDYVIEGGKSGKWAKGDRLPFPCRSKHFSVDSIYSQ
jgi:hypothetical protein